MQVTVSNIFKLLFLLNTMRSHPITKIINYLIFPLITYILNLEETNLFTSFSMNLIGKMLLRKDLIMITQA